MMYMFDVYFFRMWTSRGSAALLESARAFVAGVLLPCRCCLVILLENFGQALVAEVKHTWKRQDKMEVSINGGTPKWMVYNGKSY